MTMSEARLRRLSERVLAARHVNGARALGWRRYRQAGCGYGGDWFRLAAGLERRRQARRQDRRGLWRCRCAPPAGSRDAEALAYPWIDKDPR